MAGGSGAPSAVSTDPNLLLNLLTAFATGVSPLRGLAVPHHPQPPAIPPADLPIADHTAGDANLAFPTLREWLWSIRDDRPELSGYADSLEAQGLTHLNDVDNSDLTVELLIKVVGMKFVDASAFLRLARKASQVFRDAHK